MSPNHYFLIYTTSATTKTDTQEADDTHDEDYTIHPEAIEVPYDDIDRDCDGLYLADVDWDGYDAKDNMFY